MRRLYYLFFILIIYCYITSITAIKKRRDKSLEKNLISICEKWKEMNRHYNACYPGIEDESLLDNEKIDVLIKYIDLSDENLHREGLPNIKKDIENGEIRYSIRSILENIPWINKIYILMPNDKVKYFKDKEFIKEKIIYLRDKDVLGFDSASSITFEFNLWRLKNFNVSTNFMYFNDDCFVGKRLKKSDLFYQENGEVHPYILGKKGKIDKKSIERKAKIDYNKVVKRKKKKQDSKEFNLNSYNAILFIYKLFGKKAIIRRFNHNAFGVNLKDNEEIYNITVTYYDHQESVTKAISRNENAMTYQYVHINYLINKYKRRFKVMDTKYYDIRKNYGNNNLFVVNRGGQKKYHLRDLGKSIIKMNKKFPFPNKYEKIDVNNGFYILETAVNQNMNLNLNYDSENKVNLVLNNRNEENSIFYIEYLNDGTYSIKNIKTNLYLGVSEKESVDEFGVPNKEFTLQYNKIFDGNNQKWYFLTNTKDYFYIVAGHHSQCALDVNMNNIKDKFQITCYICKGGKNQLFKLIKSKK